MVADVKTEQDNMLCRFHKGKGMSVCNCDDHAMQKTCKYWLKSSSYRPRPEFCAYWSRDNFVWNGFHHCNHYMACNEAQSERKNHIN